jgi:hypothetical protein
MKANEIILGTYVYFNCFDGSKIVVRVTGFNDGIVYGDSKNGSHWCNIKNVEPIPLTPEILEKNEFKPYIPENHLETVYACQDVSKAVANELYALWSYQDGSFYLLLRVGGKDMVRMDVHYIHQIQHALRLCGIEKTIEL